jgi:hypothetical protein
MRRLSAKRLCLKFGTVPNFNLLFGQKKFKLSFNKSRTTPDYGLRRGFSTLYEVSYALECRDALQDAA